MSMHCLLADNVTHNSISLASNILPPVVILGMIVGLPGSLVALWIFCFRMKAWKPNTVFLFNLMLADFFLLVSVPFRIDALLCSESWEFGPVWCRINLFMLAVNRSVSIAFMTTVAIDRYVKVVHPHHRVNRITKTQANKLAGLIWAVGLALCLPLLGQNFLHQQGGIKLCRSFNTYEEDSPGIKLLSVFYVMEFFLPLLVLIFCAARISCVLHRRKLTKDRRVRRALHTVVTIVVLFVVCFMPGVTTGLAAKMVQHFNPEDCVSYNMLTELFSLSIGFTYLNSALDPVIYCLSSSRFRDALMGMITKPRVGGVVTQPTSSNCEGENNDDNEGKHGEKMDLLPCCCF